MNWPWVTLIFDYKIRNHGSYLLPSASDLTMNELQENDIFEEWAINREEMDTLLNLVVLVRHACDHMSKQFMMETFILCLHMKYYIYAIIVLQMWMIL